MEMGNNLKTKWIVYHVLCLVNKKIYIGVHKTETPYEFDGYIGNGIEVGYTIKNTNTAYLRALKKYGYKNFIRTTLKVFDNEQDALNLEAELVDLDFIKRRDTYNIALGGRGHTHYKQFYQYDLNGNFLKKWYSREDIINHYKNFADTNRIRRAIDNKYSAFDSYWTDVYVEHLDTTSYRVSMVTSVYKVNQDGEIVDIYNSEKEAAEKNNVPVKSIYDCVHKKCILKQHYYTKDPGNIENIIKLAELNGISDRTLSIYKDDKIVKSFVSRKALAQYLNVKDGDIKKALSEETELNGYKIQYGFFDTFGDHKQPGLKVEQYDLDGNLIKTWNTIAECAKEYPKVRLVLKGIRNKTKGYTFKVI